VTDREFLYKLLGVVQASKQLNAPLDAPSLERHLLEQLERGAPSKPHVGSGPSLHQLSR
jgi:hypothetical protein